MVYLVKAKIKPYHPKTKEVNFKPVIVQGVFVPTGEVSHKNNDKIREQCKAFLLKNIKLDNPDLEFKMTLTINGYDNKFTLHEDRVNE
jgi:hypothetical protein